MLRPRVSALTPLAIGLALALSGADVEAAKPSKLVVRQFYGPFGVAAGEAVRLAGHNLLPNAGGQLTCILVDAESGDLIEQATFDLEPRTGAVLESFFDMPPGARLMVTGIVRFESGDPTAWVGPALASSVQVFGLGFESRIYQGETASAREKRRKSVVERVYGPFFAEPGDTVRLAAQNLLLGGAGLARFALLDAISGQRLAGTELVIDPGVGEGFTVVIENPGDDTLMGVVRFESGDLSAFRGPTLTSSVEVLGPTFETKLFDGDFDRGD